MKHCVIIYNPTSGRQKKEAWFNKVQKILKQYNYNSEFYKTEYAGHAKEIIQKIDADLVISIGGDGTLNEVMSGNLNRNEQLLLSHLPYGTTNDVGKMYGFGKNMFRNLRMILEGTIHRVDLCFINEQPFVYIAGFGNFVPISYETPKRLKRKYGYFAYLIQGIKSINQQASKSSFDIEIDGKIYHKESSFVLISNANRIAGINYFYQDVKLDDHVFEVLLCDLTNKKDLLKSLYDLKIKGIKKVKGCTTLKTNHLIITFKKQPLKFWCVDGEKYKNDTLIYDIRLDHQVKMLLPNKKVKQLFLEQE